MAVPPRAAEDLGRLLVRVAAPPRAAEGLGRLPVRVVVPPLGAADRGRRAVPPRQRIAVSLRTKWRGPANFDQDGSYSRTRRPAFRDWPTLFFILASDRSALLGPRRLCGVELPVALFDAASALVPGYRCADMVWSRVFACSGDFLLRFAGCQGKDLIVEARRTPPAAGRFCGRSAPGARVVPLEHSPAFVVGVLAEAVFLPG
jgi:hypothetical protein